MPDHTSTSVRHAWVGGYMRWIIRFRLAVILATAVIVVVVAYGARFLNVDPDTRVFFSETSPERIALEHFEDTYGRWSSVIIIVEPLDGDVFTPATLSFVAYLTEAAWGAPYATRVSSLSNYKFSYADGDTFYVDDLVPERESISVEDAREIRERALSEEPLVDQLVSKNGDITAISVALVPPEGMLGAVPEIATWFESLADARQERNPGIRLRLTGSVMADAAFADSAYRDMRTLIPAMGVLVLLSLWIGLRAVTSVAATMAVVLMSMAVAMGFAGWQGVTLNSVTAAAPIMAMTLAISDCIHILATVGQLMRKGSTRVEAIIESQRLNWVPILITSLTTAISFLALNFADSPPLNEVGNIVATGVMAAWLLSVTFFPALLAALPEPKRLPTLSDPKFLDLLAEKVIAWRKPLRAGSVVVVVVIAAGAGGMRLNDDFIEYFPEQYPFREASEFLQDRLTGLHALSFSLPSGEEGGVNSPEYLVTVDAFESWLGSQEKVTHVTSIAGIQKRLNQNMHGDDPAFFRVPESRDLAAQYLFLYEMSLPEGADLNNQIDVAKSASRVTANLADATSEDIRGLAEQSEAWLADRGIASRATGLSVLYANLSANNIRAMLGGSIIELVIISFMMILLLRSWTIGLVSLVPNLVPITLTFGLWGWTGQEVNLAISVVGAMTFGIVVDDTIHSMTKYMRARRELMLSPLDSVRYTFVAAGHPMLLTGVTLILGFGVLSFSGFAVSHQMGLMSAVTISLAIIADLIMLPPLLLLFDRERSARSGQPR